MKQLSIAWALALGLCAGACGGPGAQAPVAPNLARPLADAIVLDASGEPLPAAQAFARVLDASVRDGADPWQAWIVGASLDALVIRAGVGLGAHGALAGRLPDPRVSKDRDIVGNALADAYAHASGPFARGLVAGARERLAARRGDAKLAEDMRTASACAREATVIGPVSWTPVTGSASAGPWGAADARIEPTYAGDGPFARAVTPAILKARGCSIGLSAQSALPGVRDVVVDIDVPSAQTIGVALRAEGAAVLRVGGRAVIERPYSLGGEAVTRLALVQVTAGRVRLVARTGADQATESVSIHVWNASGQPLRTHAPRVGDVGTGRATSSIALAPPTARTQDERVALAAGLLAFGEARTAERVLWDTAAAPAASHGALVVFARALWGARDLSSARRAERLRALHDKVLERWPETWESVIAHAELAADRKGQTEARVEALRDLGEHRGKVVGMASSLLDAYGAATAGQEDLHDLAKAGIERARRTLATTTVLADAQRMALPRGGRERVGRDCNERSARAADELDCYDALAAVGDLSGAAKELDRVRTLRGAPTAMLGLSLRDALVRGDRAAALAALGAMSPGERTFAAWQFLTRATDRSELARVAGQTGDAPAAIAPMFRWLGDDPVSAFDDVAERIAKGDRAHPALPDAGTAILHHVERYEVTGDGLLHAVQLDIRRVGGTTDVEANAQAYPADVMGRSSTRSLRRRIFKNDGRVLTPDPTPNAAQAHADLAQLEKGDLIESVYESFALPQYDGNLGVDTPDLLPERTAVEHAEIEVVLPKALEATVWSHALLGKPDDRTEARGRVLRWTVDHRATRRVEEGTPKMDRAARVSWSTARWTDVARGLREVLAALDDRNIEVERFAREAGQGKPPGSRELVQAVVAKVGEMVRESNANVLSDFAFGRPSGPQGTTARTILSDREGSRTWLVVRVLRELGMKVDVGIAENEPFSADATFPAHFGRFTHPLCVAHATGSDRRPGDVWVDADVSGPPLPAGRVSPELRGRTVLMDTGQMVKVPTSDGEGEKDEIDLRLVLEANGDAHGDLTVLLRGRAAQEISEALLRVVGFERERALRSIALAWVPFADVDRVALSSSEGSWQVALRAGLTVRAYAAPDGKGPSATWVLPGMDPVHTVFPRPWNSTLASTYAGQGARQNAFSINRAIQYHVHRRVVLPAGTQVVRAPAALEVRTHNLEASRRVTTSTEAIDEEFALSVATGTIAADRYAAFVGDAQRIDAGFLASTRLKPSK